MAKNIETLQAECSTCPVPVSIKNELCYMCATQHMIRGKWKFLILWTLRQGVKRFSQLQSEIPNVKQGPLTAQLKELTQSGLIRRKSYNVVPPHVEYSLTPKGMAFLDVMQAMDLWARKNLFL
jgi:DNA-binding HxlR family transcriptional regulator